MTRIGIDEIGYRKGQRYLTVVVDHDSGHLVWAAEGRNERTPERFFDALGETRSARLTHISADAAEWIERVVRRRASQADLCIDPFHVVAPSTEALDAVRREVTERGPVGGRDGAREGSEGRPVRAHRRTPRS